MAVQRLVDYHLTRLKDKRDDIKLQAIEELVLLEATEALTLLEEVYRSDLSENVRRAAKSAGKKLLTIQLLRDQERG